MEAIAWRFLLSSEREAEEAWQRMLGDDAPAEEWRRGRRRRGSDRDRWVFGGETRREAAAKAAANEPSPALLPRLLRLLAAFAPR